MTKENTGLGVCESEIQAAYEYKDGAGSSAFKGYVELRDGRSIQCTKQQLDALEGVKMKEATLGIELGSRDPERRIS